MGVGGEQTDVKRTSTMTTDRVTDRVAGRRDRRNTYKHYDDREGRGEQTDAVRTSTTTTEQTDTMTTERGAGRTERQSDDRMGAG